jgi:hypothetical protein
MWKFFTGSDNAAEAMDRAGDTSNEVELTANEGTPNAGTGSDTDEGTQQLDRALGAVVGEAVRIAVDSMGGTLSDPLSDEDPSQNHEGGPPTLGQTIGGAAGNLVTELGVCSTLKDAVASQGNPDVADRDDQLGDWSGCVVM